MESPEDQSSEDPFPLNAITKDDRPSQPERGPQPELHDYTEEELKWMTEQQEGHNEAEYGDWLEQKWLRGEGRSRGYH
jgi:hypothetical protein